ncbi:hypothetical protein [Paeniglutamicibacter cryotolerans]|uniref:Dehydrogenase n=1 Tax=Paeniglutamicibacter cryotolerans TaxID=670079 RepID=A0A839QNC5_9MICC|nr:hypothetical protein [Paeniglutamicibacter cryotolerans]MBB2997270.1 hypothetical protein [Paeniglutamicibacter cryotolerans]
MSKDPRVALSVLVSAFEEHLAMLSARRGPEDPNVITAYFAIAEAFENYEDALDETYDEGTPLEVFSEDDYDDED